MHSDNIHKIYYKDGQKQYITKGDYNNVEDSTILTIDSIEGKVEKLNELSEIEQPDIKAEIAFAITNINSKGEFTYI